MLLVPAPARPRPRLSLVFSLLACWAGAAAGSTVLGLDVTALTGGSEAVVHAKVKRVSSRWTRDSQQIVTDVELEVIEPLKGPPGRTVRVQQPGGVVGDVGQKVSGLATFREGEEVVVFLERVAPERFGVTGMAQGKFRIERPAGGEPTAVPEDTTGARLLDPFSGKPTASLLQATPLETLKAQIRAAAGKARP